jgi:hypothetical protein
MIGPWRIGWLAAAVRSCCIPEAFGGRKEAAKEVHT